MSQQRDQQSESRERLAIRAASQWYVRLNGDSANEHVRERWQHWLEADPAHRQAWQHIETMSRQMGRVKGDLASRTLGNSGQSRRQALRMLMVLASVGGVTALGWRSQLGEQLRADYRSATGERRAITLADGSQLLLNTASAVDMLFDDRQRLLKLHAGEILITTASDSQHRPFLVETAHGRVQALGTRFTVRTFGNSSEVAVLEKAVELRVPGVALAMHLEAGQRARFTLDEIQTPQANDASATAWQQGSLIAINQPLGELLAELSRYRTGWLHCDPRIADMKVSGSFPVDDTERALNALTRSFPLQILRRTRYWVTVAPKD